MKKKFAESSVGEVVCTDPDLARAQCIKIFHDNIDRILHFERRANELGYSPEEAVIVLLNVDDVGGKLLAEALMPNCDWQAIRDRGLIPMARGLAGREGIQKIIDTSYESSVGDTLRNLRELSVVVLSDGIASIFSASQAHQSAN